MNGKTFTDRQIIRAMRIKRQTLTKLEEEGIVVPELQGDEKIYDTGQVAEILFALDLRKNMGVNWAGVEVALQMRRNMFNMMSQFEEFFELFRETISRMVEEEFGERS